MQGFQAGISVPIAHEKSRNSIEWMIFIHWFFLTDIKINMAVRAKTKTFHKSCEKINLNISVSTCFSHKFSFVIISQTTYFKFAT